MVADQLRVSPEQITGGGDLGMFFEHADHLGTPQVFTDEAGQVAWSGDCLPFGEVVESGSIVNRARFPGQYVDQESGLHYNYFRSYDPSLGRHKKSDPIGVAAGSNTFVYVFNQPLSLTDILGLDVDINLLSTTRRSSIDYERMRAVNPPIGSISIGGHGNPSALVELRRYPALPIRNLEPMELALEIRKLENYSPDAPVFINACDAGTGENSPAKRLADLLSNPVYANPGLIEIDSEGNVIPPIEDWKKF